MVWPQAIGRAEFSQARSWNRSGTNSSRGVCSSASSTRGIGDALRAQAHDQPRAAASRGVSSSRRRRMLTACGGAPPSTAFSACTVACGSGRCAAASPRCGPHRSRADRCPRRVAARACEADPVIVAPAQVGALFERGRCARRGCPGAVTSTAFTASGGTIGEVDVDQHVFGPASSSSRAITPGRWVSAVSDQAAPVAASIAIDWRERDRRNAERHALHRRRPPCPE